MFPVPWALLAFQAVTVPRQTSAHVKYGSKTVTAFRPLALGMEAGAGTKGPEASSGRKYIIVPEKQFNI